MAHIQNRGYAQEVVGESHYIHTLAKAFRTGDIQNNGTRSYLTLQIVPENNNRYDDQAVAVVSEYGTVGYLSRDDAREYRRLFTNFKTHTCNAVIVSHDGTKFGVYLGITLTENGAKNIVPDAPKPIKQLDARQVEREQKRQQRNAEAKAEIEAKMAEGKDNWFDRFVYKLINK